MAKTNGKKDNFLRNMIVGSAAVLVILIGAILILDITNPTLTYDDFQEVGYYELVGSMPEGDYVVYFYAEDCSHCNAIKSNMMDFGKDNAMDLPLYLLDAATTAGDRGIIDLDGQQMTGTPTLLVFHDNQLVDFYIGDTPILAFIEGVEDGSYSFE
jgi:thiol-disulfide isomerase/thioredoxin